MKDIAMLKSEIHHLERKYGGDNVHWDNRRYEWLAILNYLLPPGLNRRQTRIIVLLPEGYGNGAPLIDSFLEPDLQAVGRDGKPVSIAHYFKTYRHSESLLSSGSADFWSEKGYWWLCLQDIQHGMTSQTATIRQYLNHIYAFFSEPSRDWQKMFTEYRSIK